MNTLRYLIKTLNNSEKKLVENFYRLRCGEKKLYQGRLKLFQLISGNEFITEAQALQEIAPDKPMSWLATLQKGLRHDIMDILILSEAERDPEVTMEIECRKHLMQGKLMINRGFIDEGITTLKSTLVKSEELELHDVCLSIYSILSSYEHRSFYDENPHSINVVAEDYALSVLQSVNEHPDHYSDVEVAGLHLEIASLYLRQQNYAEALGYSLSAATNLRDHPNPKLAALRIAFLAYYHSSDLANASRIVKDVTSSPLMYSSTKLIAVWSLNKAALQYAKRDYWGAMETLKSNYPIIRHNPFWVAGYRFLEILNVIELRDYEWVEYKLEVVRKFLSKKHRDVSFRMKMGYKLLRKYLDFKKGTRNSNAEHHIKIKPSWDPLSSEIINIEEWYKMQMIRAHLQ